MPSGVPPGVKGSCWNCWTSISVLLREGQDGLVGEEKVGLAVLAGLDRGAVGDDRGAGPKRGRLARRLRIPPRRRPRPRRTAPRATAWLLPRAVPRGGGGQRALRLVVPLLLIAMEVVLLPFFSSSRIAERGPGRTPPGSTRPACPGTPACRPCRARSPAPGPGSSQNGSACRRSRRRPSGRRDWLFMIVAAQCWVSNTIRVPLSELGGVDRDRAVLLDVDDQRGAD